jgi:phage/plasmid-associated DNA primase
VIGIENVAHLRTEHLSGRFESHAFLNKKLLTAKDVPGDFLARRGAQMLKALVGDDLIESEMKYGGKFRMRGNFNIIVTSNNRLRVGMEDDEPAWRRRLIVIRFGGSAPDKRIANFGDTLLREEGKAFWRGW